MPRNKMLYSDLELGDEFYLFNRSGKKYVKNIDDSIGYDENDDCVIHIKQDAAVFKRAELYPQGWHPDDEVSG